MVTIVLAIVATTFSFTNAAMRDCEIRLRKVEGASIRVDEKLANIENMTKGILNEMKDR